MVTFTFNNKQYTTNNLENKLLKLGATMSDIKILNKDYGIVDADLKPYYYTDGKSFTGVFWTKEVPLKVSLMSWCKGWLLKEGTPDISMFSDKLLKILKDSYGIK